MKRKFLYSSALLLCVFSFQVLATPQSLNSKEIALGILKKIEDENNNYIKNKAKNFFDKKSAGQTPIITLLSCSDSRVHTDVIDSSPEGEIFIIKNIGNQMQTALGSVKYGINHLKTPLLLILGHSQCGAIKTVLQGNFAKLEPSLIKELDTFHLKKEQSTIEAVKENVNDQVAVALKKFHKKVASGDLLIVGAVYDFANDMKKGEGKLNIINIQGKPVKD